MKQVLAAKAADDEMLKVLCNLFSCLDRQDYKQTVTTDIVTRLG